MFWGLNPNIILAKIGKVHRFLRAVRKQPSKEKSHVFVAFRIFPMEKRESRGRDASIVKRSPTLSSN